MTDPLYIPIQCTQNGSIMFCPWKEQLQVLLQQSYYSSGYWRNVGFQSTIKLWIVHFEEIWENRNLHMKRALKTLFIYCAYLQWSQYNSITLFMSIEVCSILFGWLAIQSLMLTVRLFTNKILEIRSKCFNRIFAYWRNVNLSTLDNQTWLQNDDLSMFAWLNLKTQCLQL